MASLAIRHLVERVGADGPRWYWQPSTALRASGWASRRLCDAQGVPLRDVASAAAAAEAINAELDAWRASQGTTLRRAPRAGTVAALVTAYRRSRFWRDLAPETQRGYAHHLAAILAWAGDRPARAITPPEVQAFHALMLGRRRVRAAGGRWVVEETPARAAAAVAVLRLLLESGRRLGLVSVNAAARPGIAHTRQREPQLWSPAAVAAMARAADEAGLHSMATAILLNAWIGQREADVLALAPYAVEEGALRLRQGKRGRLVALPVHLVGPLVARLREDAARPGVVRSPTHLLVCELTGQPWNATTFRHHFAAIRARAAEALPECAGLRFMELRHTAVTRLHEAGVDPLGIASITGHAPGSVLRIVGDHYLVRTEKAAAGAFTRRLAEEAAGAGI